MRVAIIGAGPSSLACALALEQRGVYPDIFESNSKVGYIVPRVEILLQLFQRPQRDPLCHLLKNFGLKFKPLGKVHRYIMHSSQQKKPIIGDLGYLVERGQGQEAVEVQLAGKLRSKIFFDTMANYRQLIKDYEFVVVGEGNLLVAKELKILESTLSAWVKGAVVLGQFDPETALIFFNTGYAKHGFGSLKPFSRDRALLALNIQGITQNELDFYWNRFLDREKFKFDVVETFKIPYTTGLTSRQRVGKILFIGNSGGFTDSFLGLGLYEGILSGTLAGIAIAEALSYEQLIKPLVRQIRQRFVFREALNTLDDTGINRLLSFIALPGIKQLIYNTNIDIIGLMYPYIKNNGEKSKAPAK